MPDLTVSSAVDTLMQASNQAGLRSALALGNSATLNTGTTAGTVATGDHTHNASAITDGTLDAARLPAPGTTTLGGVKRNTGSAGQFVNGIDTDGSLQYGTPSGGGSAETLVQLDADVSITDDTTFQDITTGTSAIEFTVEANKIYKIEFEFSVRTNATTTGFEVGIDGPASPVSIFSTTFLSNSAVGESGQVVFDTAYGSIGANANSGGAFARPAFGMITFRNGSNAGTFKIQGKVETGVTGTVTFDQGSLATIRELTT